MAEPKYRRVVLKISGEGLCGEGKVGIDADELNRIGGEIKSVVDLGAQVSVVVGAGNIVRGAAVAANSNIEEVTGHHMGMLATVINALAIQDTLEVLGLETRVQSAIGMSRVCERFVRRRAMRHLDKGRVVIFGAGTGNPFVTTDSCAALRASEIKADAVLKATKVDGVYDADPITSPNAKKFERLSFEEAISRRLKVMDVSAFDLCQRNHIPVIVFNLRQPGNMAAVVQGKPIGTLVS